MQAGASRISDVIAAIGRPELPHHLLSHLFGTYRVEACAMYRLKRKTPVAVLTSTIGSKEAAQRQADMYLQRSFWLRDPAMAEACGEATKSQAWSHHMDVRSLSDQTVRNVFTTIRIRERLIVSGGAPSNQAVLTLVKTDTNDGFSDRQRTDIETNAPMLLSILSKHMELSDCASGVSEALTSLQLIERCIAESTLNLSRREGQVAARIVYGISHAGIAVDLGVSEETVATYRKRLYRRLEMGSQRELVLLYLKLWSASRGALALGGERDIDFFGTLGV